MALQLLSGFTDPNQKLIGGCCQFPSSCVHSHFAHIFSGTPVHLFRIFQNHLRKAIIVYGEYPSVGSSRDALQHTRLGQHDP